MGAGYGLFISVGKWVVNLGKWGRVQGRDSRVCKMIKMINYMFWAEQVGVDAEQNDKLHCSIRRGQCVDSGFWEFLQTPRGRIFSYLVYF